MRRFYLVIILVLFLIFSFWCVKYFNDQSALGYGAPPYIEEDFTDNKSVVGLKGLSDLINWKRPEGPLRIGLQVGHWKNNELPDELEKIRGNSGAAGRGIAEWEVNMAIARETEKLLESRSIVVDILPATIPPSYWADAFVAIHADGSSDPETSGFKVAAPRRDYSGKASKLASLIEEVYGEAVGISRDPNVTRNMRGYYAFSWWRYEHAVHPMTPSVILETGFLTNPEESKLLIERPGVPARALFEALIKYLNID